LRKHPAGLTWKELAVVVVGFSLVMAALFLAARNLQRDTNRPFNILNIRNVQAAVRGHQELKGMKIGDPLDSSFIVSPDGSTGYLKTPHPPADLPPYTYRSDIPPLGTLYVTNHFDHPIYGFVTPADYKDW
jgi:hypothetical protein